ncbi:stalk domain-containing protein [uncultured Fenollaria sp.]|uniref:stalk domain-containing protein n=1 Tax=uncultured Fenollaria sp. TaxID=1686315 RepID=UPI0025EF3372|nr:stalk domain-containing protein [uncultured Fenollaria sp.]
MSKNKELTYLNCSQNKLSNLNLENNPLITKLSISWNEGFKELKLANDNKLDTLYCTNMRLEKLDLSNCNNLKELNCESNNLKELDLSNCLEITDVTCSYNSLTSLDLSKNAKLNSFNGYLQNYTMTLIPGTKLVNPDILPGKFDISNVSNLQNADIDQGKLSLHDNIDSIEYVYEVRDGRNMGCKININYYVDLTINTPPSNVEYTEGDKLDLSGLVVTLTDKQNNSINVDFKDFGKYNIKSDPENGKELTTSHTYNGIIISAGTLKAKVNVTVNEKPFDIEKVESIEVINQPTNLIYTEGDKLDLSGLEIKLTDSNKKTKNIEFSKFKENGIAIDPANGTELKLEQNGKTVKITKGKGSADTDPLTVNARVFDPDHVKSIEVTEQPKKLTYTEEEALDLDGLVVTLTDNQGTTKEVPFTDFETYGLVATPANETALTVAVHNGETVKITKGNLSAETAALTVNSKGFDLDNVKTIEVISQPSILIYTEGEKLDLAGLKVKLIDNNNKFKEVSFEDFDENGIKTDPANDADLKVADNGKTVTITKGKGRAETDPLTVNPKVFDSQNIAKIEVKTQPKLDYTEGNKLDLSKLEVTLTDNQGLTKDVTFDNFDDYGLTATPTNDTALTVDDHDGKNVTITKGNASAETKALTVKAKENPPAPTDPKIIGPLDPNAPETVKPSPNEYWTVTFESEDAKKGTVDGANTFYIPMTENKKLSDLKAPAVKANPGFEFEKWSLAKDTAIDKNLTVKAIFIEKGNTPNPPTPQDPDPQVRDYWIIRFLSDNPYRGYIGYGETLRIEKNRGYRFEDLARLAPEAIPYSGYEFAGWSPYLYGNQDIIKGDINIYARFEEIYVPRYSYERRRPRRIYDDRDDRDDRDDSKEEKPVETNEYDKLEAILFINDSIMQKSVNGVVSQVRMDIAPFIYQARTMLPIRYVAESLGFMVTWDANTRTVYLVDKENIVQIPVDTNNIIVNGKAFVSDVKPMIKNNRTMLPVANVARALGLQDGKDILWDAAMKFVTLRRNVLK